MKKRWMILIITFLIFGVLHSYDKNQDAMYFRDEINDWPTTPMIYDGDLDIWSLLIQSDVTNNGLQYKFDDEVDWGG